MARCKLGGPILEANDALLNLLGYSREELRAGALQLERITPPEHAEASRRAFATLKESGVAPDLREGVHPQRRRASTRHRWHRLARCDHGRYHRLRVGHHVAEGGRATDRAAFSPKSGGNALARSVRLDPLARAPNASRHPGPANGARFAVDREERARPRGGEKAYPTLPGGNPKARGPDRSAAGFCRGFTTASCHCRWGRSISRTAKSVVSGLEGAGLCPPGQIKVIAPTPIVGRWDAIRIDGVLTNLCSNAIKYGAGAPVEVRIDAEASRKTARIEVIDHGIGIEHTMLSKICRSVSESRFGGARARLGAWSSHRAIHRGGPWRHGGCNE